MSDREKVIKELENYESYAHVFSNITVTGHVVLDALALLREQEPLTIHDPGAICPNCKWPLYPEDHPNYCGNCGKAVKWK